MSATTQLCVQTVPLVAGQHLLIEQLPERNLLQIVGPDGQARFSLEITRDGPVLRFDRGGLTIRAAGPLAIDAEAVAIHGREGVAITSGGDALIAARGDLESRARIQNLTAVLGNVNIRANDDVKLDGERIRMNC
jgi:hypothetical protein